MATIYTVCANDAAKSVSIVMSVGTTRGPFRYYDDWGCSVEEFRATLSFTISSGGPSDEDFTIWYNFDRDSYVNGSLTNSSDNLISSVTMPAGQVYVTKEVLISQERVCGDDGDGIYRTAAV